MCYLSGLVADLSSCLYEIFLDQLVNVWWGWVMSKRFAAYCFTTTKLKGIHTDLPMWDLWSWLQTPKVNKCGFSLYSQLPWWGIYKNWWKTDFCLKPGINIFNLNYCCPCNNTHAERRSGVNRQWRSRINRHFNWSAQWTEATRCYLHKRAFVLWYVDPLLRNGSIKTHSW